MASGREGGPPLQGVDHQWRAYPNQNDNSTIHMEHSNNKKSKAFRGYANMVTDKRFPSDKQLLVIQKNINQLNHKVQS